MPEDDRNAAGQEQDLRATMVELGRLLHDKGMLAATDGNISCRLGRERLLLTPSGVHKGRLAPDDLVVTDLFGTPAGPGRRPSAEYRMHTAIYGARPDAAAVVHAHPPAVIALTVAGLGHLLSRPVLPEVVATFGAIPMLPYATPTSGEVPEDVGRLIRHHEALVLDRHGAVTIGPDLWIAYHRMEKLEHAAQIISLAHRLGRVKELNVEQVRRVQALTDGGGSAGAH